MIRIYLCFFSGAILRDSAFFLCVKLVAVGERKAVREHGRVRQRRQG